MKKYLNISFSTFLLISMGYLLWQVKVLNILPVAYYLVLAGILVLVWCLLTIFSFRSKKTASTVFIQFLCLILCSISLIGGYYIQKANQTLNSVTTNVDTNENYVTLIGLKNSSLQTEMDFESKKIGVLENIDSLSTEQMIQNLQEKHINFQIENYSSVDTLIQALYNKEVDGIVLNETYRISISDLEEFKNFDEDTKIIYTFIFDTKVEKNSNNIENIAHEPFNVLITGTDSRFGVNAISRSDVNMIATINPQTGIVLLTSIPRDYYVPEVCSAAEGCPNGQLDKLTHTGNHGMNCVRKTIEGFMDIKINYSLKVSFDSVTQLVDALGGIDVYSDKDFTDAGNGNTACKISEGMNHLNGECALGFARERYAYAEGDRHRIKNQQDVLVAIAKKVLSPSMIIHYSEFMDALKGTFVTDIPMEEIQNLIQYQIQTNTEWKFEQYFLNGVGDWGFSAEMGQDLYMMYPDKETIKTGKEKIEMVLAGKSSDEIDSLKNEKKNKVKKEWEGY